MLSLEDALQTSAALDEKIAAEKSDGARETLRQKKAQVDFYAFGLFKQAGMEQVLPSLYKGLGLGVGVGLPALGVGHLLMRDANHQAKDLVHDTRNQVALTALGLGGMQALGNAVGSYMQPRQREEMQELTLPGNETYSGRHVVKLSQEKLFDKLAAHVTLDNMLEHVINTSTGEVKEAAIEQLFTNREVGVALLKSALQ